MFKIFISTISVFFIFTITGCEKLQSGSDTVVLDLDAIAQATGQAAIIKKQIESANQELNTQLGAISGKLNEQLAEEKQKMGKKPSKEEKRNLEQLTLLANQKMQQAKMVASQKSQQYQAALIQQLRQKVKPIAENIARQRGATIVKISNSTMIWFDPVIDITDEIIAEMRADTTAHMVTQPTESAQIETTDQN